jgi:hypothetical protein
VNSLAFIHLKSDHSVLHSQHPICAWRQLAHWYARSCLVNNSATFGECLPHFTPRVVVHLLCDSAPTFPHPCTSLQMYILLSPVLFSLGPNSHGIPKGSHGRVSFWDAMRVWSETMCCRQHTAGKGVAEMSSGLGQASPRRSIDHHRSPGSRYGYGIITSPSL